MMKIALIGHTKGLGAELSSYFKDKYDVVGFSRTNGYNIKNPIDRKKILKESTNADILLNLVHNYYHQTDILFEFYSAWEDQKKLILNISSAVVDDNKWGINRLDYLEYKNQKIALESMAELLLKRNSTVQIKNYRISEINFGKDTNNLNSIINEFKISKK